MTTQLHRKSGKAGISASASWLVAIALAVALVACSGGDSEDTAPASGSTPAGAAADKAPKPEITEAGTMPKGFDLPTYPDAEPAGSMAVPGGGSLSAFKAKAPQNDVFAFYLSELPKQGWSIESQNDEQTEIRATSGSRNVVIRLVSRGGTTEIAVVEGG